MTESLFDNRYRYDYIYPRGRSGETLRAVDIRENERRVVIKRPAPADAPPIRAGQEVSIANEKKALKRLAGHPVLTDLIGEGNFNAGGVVHQYIVMERAEGLIVADLVGELAAAGERIPELELLIIVDNALDLLRTAHAKDIVYNDVDARHLFWSRETYRLKMIDWGNAVFLEGDTATPQGISRQTDIYQVGELLFFMLTGGRRAEVPRDAGNDFAVNFGDDARRVHSHLQNIVNKALHPNTRYRYQTIVELRNDLVRYRAPLEQQRNSAVGGVVERLRQGGLTKSELRDLLATLEPALARDTGYPPARSAFEEIHNRLRDLNVGADLDAVRIYMTSHNWTRAAELLRELQDQAGPQTRGLVGLLLDVAGLLDNSGLQPLPEPITQAVNMMYDGQPAGAATLLLTDATEDNTTRLIAWQMAERISAHIPEVLLLRPNLYRLQTSLRQLAIDGLAVTEARSVLAEVDKLLDQIAVPPVNLNQLRDRYRAVVEQLSALNPILTTIAAQYQLPVTRLPVNSLDRALNAAMALADNMHVIGRQATANPRDAQNALVLSRATDPANPIWDELENLLDALYDLLQACHQYVPAADGMDLQDWLKQTHTALVPFIEKLADERLVGMVRDLDEAQAAWRAYRDVVIQGDKDGALEAIDHAANTVSNLSPSLHNWFSHLRSILNNAQYIERNSVPGALGRALADGWSAFDRSRLAEAEHLGKQAYESARTEAERFAASRLLDLARMTNDWVERGGVTNRDRTQSVLAAVDKLFTADEKGVLEGFTTQMPSIETYLKAMSRGLVAVYARRSTAALRLLFVHYLMLSALDANEGLLNDSSFWREAALKTLAEGGEQHVATRALDTFVTRSYDLIAAHQILQQAHGRQALANLPMIRRQLEENAQARVLVPGIQALREVEVALKDWSDGEFKAAGMKIESAVRGIGELEQILTMPLDATKAWLMELMSVAADLHVQSREMRAHIDARPAEPDDVVTRVHETQVALTEQYIGELHAGTLRQWRDTYNAFVAAYHTDERRSRRLERFNELFRAMFIDRHPAYALYRHWYAVLEGASEFPAPASEDPMPRIETYVVADDDYSGGRYGDEGGGRRIPRGMLIGGAGVGAALILALVLISIFSSNQSGDDIKVTISATPAVSTTEPVAAALQTEETEAAPTGLPTLATEKPTTSSEIVFNTPEPLSFVTNTTTPVPVTNRPDNPTPTITQVPSDTATKTATYTPTPQPTDTATITNTPTPTHTPTNTPLPPQGVQGEVDLLTLLNDAENLPFNPEMFAPVEGGWRIGTGSESTGGVLIITPPPELLEAAYGNNAAARIRRVEADLTLRTFNPAIVSSKDVYFGILIQSATDGSNAGIRLEAVGSNSINLARVLNNETGFLNQRSVNALVARLRIDRDVNTGAVSLYFNDIPMGASFAFLPADAPVIPAIFVRDGGVVVGVTNWRVTLR